MRPRQSSADLLRRAQDIFEAALAVPPEQRAALLERECAGDEDLLRDAATLLEHAAAGMTLWRSAVGESAAEIVLREEQSWIGRRIGVWKITAVLGMGGMGAVYEVERDDGTYRQRAALKISRSDFDTEEVRRRFVEERQILAGLEHPNIARLLDGGTSEDGLPYLVMEAVDGCNIIEYCNERKLGIDNRVRLFVTVVRTVQAAHQKLIVHRDLKPANVFVTREGTVKLLDFGIAKLLTNGPASQTLDLRLTPEYASPEQVRNEPASTASDVYSLGAVLYELLTGQHAYGDLPRSTLESLEAVCRVEPKRASAVAPRAIRRKLQGDLDTVIRKAMQKDPKRRYAMAEQLAADLKRYLTGRPVSARPDTFGYRARKFVRRNPIAVTAAVAAILSLIGGSGFSLVHARRAEKRFAQVRTLANRFLFEFYASIKDLQGSTPARELVAKTALEYLDSLSQDAAGDRDLLMELGEAYQRVGDVFGDRYGPNLGKTDQAFSSYKKALDLKLQATGGEPAAARDVSSVLGAYYKVSDAHASTGNTRGAREILELGLRLADARGTRSDRISGYTRLGDFALRLGDTSAIDTFRKALAIAEEHHHRENNAASRRLLTSVVSRIARALKLSSRGEEALPVLDRALQLDAETLRAQPEDIFARRDMLTAYNDRGDILRSPFSPGGIRSRLALAEYEKSLEIAEGLMQADPRNFTARYDVLFARIQVADAWREIEPARGVRELRACLETLEQLRASNPSFQEGDRLRAMLTQAIADALTRVGDRRRAERTLNETVAAFERLLANDRMRLQMRRELILAYSDRGALLLGRGDRTGAAADSRRCTPLAESIGVEKARPIDLRESAKCYDLAGRVSALSGDTGAALTFFQKALACWREFARRGIGSEFLTKSRQSVERQLAAL